MPYGGQKSREKSRVTATVIYRKKTPKMALPAAKAAILAESAIKASTESADLQNTKSMVFRGVYDGKKHRAKERTKASLSLGNLVRGGL
jgi:hypothetical protein